MRLEIGPVNHGIIKEVYDLEEVPAGPAHPPGTRYLLVYAGCEYPSLPSQRHRMFMVLMRYSSRSEDEDRYWPAHVTPEDADTVNQRFHAFVGRNSR